MGGGNFGQKSLDRLKTKYPEASMTVVEKDKEKCELLKTKHVNVITDDAICFLERYLTKKEPGIIVPAVPVHVAYEWIKKKLMPAFHIEPIRIPEEVLDKIPNPIKGSVGQVYTSIADFICPDNCPEPDEICTVTKKPRPYLLFQRLEQLNFSDFKSYVVKSEQLAAGVGGYSPKTLFDMLSAIKKISSPVLLSTSCFCHGVINTFKIING